MKKLLILLCCLIPVVSRAQIITTIAGTGVINNTGDGGPATAASLNYPVGGVFDKYNNYYFALGFGNIIRKISPSGIISTVAGTGTMGYSGDGGPATLATFHTSNAVIVDDLGNLYVNDAENYRIRKIDAATGIITTVVGNGNAGFGGDGGPATAALIQSNNICLDNLGNMFIADAGNFRIRKVNSAGIISTYAGVGSAGIGGTGGPATAAQMIPWGLCVDATGNLYMSDDGAGETRICKINTFGIITHIAGNPANANYNGEGIPATNAGISPVRIALNKCGELYIADAQPNNRIRKINSSGYIYTVAGNGTAGYNGDNIPATNAQLNGPSGIAFDSSGNLYIADLNNYRIRKVTLPTCTPVEIENIIEQQRYTYIYPNPTTHALHIDNLQTNAGYRILSIVGAAMQQGQLRTGNNELNIRELPPGMYLLEVNEDGKRNVQKIVKE